MQLEHVNLYGQTRNDVGVIDCQRSSEEVRKEDR